MPLRYSTAFPGVADGGNAGAGDDYPVLAGDGMTSSTTMTRSLSRESARPERHELGGGKMGILQHRTGRLLGAGHVVVAGWPGRSFGSNA